MKMDFSSGAGAASNFDLIPNGQLAWAILSVRGTKGSQSGGQYLDIELTLDDNQPFARRKLFDMIGDPHFAGNSEAYRQMGLIAITRILEAGRGAGPNNMAGYQLADYSQLSGLRVPIKIKVEKGTGGHDDKNRVAEYLTPNPASQSGHKGFVALQAGQYGATAAKPAAAASGFGQPAATGAAQPGFSAAPAPAAAWGAPSAEPSTSISPTTSPSDPAATPNWMTQANAQ
jgi:hypothetical protein